MTNTQDNRIVMKTKGKITGRVTVKRYLAGTVERIEWLIYSLGKQKAKPYIKELLQRNFIGVGAQNNNIVVSSANRGRNLIAQHLGDYGDDGVRTSYPLAITYGEFGTGSTAPANSDIGLDTAVERSATASSEVVGNVVTISFFFADANLPDDTYYEFGTFTSGTITLGSGQLFNHALFSPNYVKATGEDTTVEVEFTIN